MSALPAQIQYQTRHRPEARSCKELTLKGANGIATSGRGADRGEEPPVARIVVVFLLFILSLNTALAANNPGHDTLYVLKIGDNMTGALNLTGNLTAYGIQTATFLYGSDLYIWANGSTQQAVTKPTIQVAGTQLFIDNPLAGDLRFNTLGGTSNFVRFGTGSINVVVNGTLSVKDQLVCLANGSNCQGTGSSNLTLAQINTNMGNWSADKGGLPNLTYAQITTANGNWSLDKTGVYANFTSVNTNITSLNTTFTNGLSSLPNLTYALINTNMGNASKMLGTCAAGSVMQNISATGPQCLATGTGSSNLTLGDINTNMGNWSADKATYTLLSILPGAVGQNLTHALIVTAEGNWSLDKTGVYANFTSVNTNLTSLNNTLGTVIGNKSGQGTITCAAGTILQNFTLGAGTPTGQCVATGAGSSNLTLGDINTNMGNWSADKATYTLLSILPGAVGQNLTHALIVTAEGNWSLDKTGVYANFTGMNLNITALNVTLGTVIGNKSGQGTVTCGVGTTLQNFTLGAGTPTGQCVAAGSGGSGWTNTTTQVYLANNATNVSVGSKSGIPNLFVDDTNGYVGIGTRSPTSTLHVQGTTYLNYNGDDTLWVMNNPEGYTSDLVGGAIYGAHIVISNSSSGVLLSTGAIVEINSNSAVSADIRGMEVHTLGSTSGKKIAYYATGDGAGIEYSLYTDDANARIYSAGSVGIGTLNPTTKLHVYGNTADTAIMLTDTTGASNQKNWKFGTNGNSLFLGSFDDVGTSGYNWLVVNRSGYVPDTINFATTARVLTNGNVGIGTTATAATLTVNSTSATTPQFIIQGGVKGNTTFIVNATGSFNQGAPVTEYGIGMFPTMNFSQSAKGAGIFMAPYMESNGSGYTGIQMRPDMAPRQSNGTLYGAVLIPLVQNGSNGTQNVTQTDALLLRIDTAAGWNGNLTNARTVDILTPSVGSGGRIENVYGIYINAQTSGSTSNYAIYSAGTTDKSYFGGNVGINTTLPNQALTVQGNVNVTNTTTINANASLNSCIYMPGGGRVCGNNSCLVLYSPNGNSSTMVCN